MKKILALALALIMAVSCMATNVFAVYGYADTTVEMLISAANISNASIAKGVATFDGTNQANIKLPVPLLPDETVTLHIEGTMGSAEPRMYVSTANGGGLHTNMYNNGGEEDITLNAPYALDITLTGNSAGGATHITIKTSNSGQVAPAGMTISKYSVTYSGAHNDEEGRRDALQAAIEAQVSSAYSFYYNEKYYEGEVVTAYDATNIGSGDYPWLNGTVSGKTRIAAASGRTGALQNGRWLRITVSAGSVSTLHLADYSADLNVAYPYYVVANGANTEYYFRGGEVASALEQGDIYGKQLFITTATDTAIVKIEEVTLIEPTIYAFKVEAPAAGQILDEVLAVNVEDAENTYPLYWFVGEEQCAEGTVAEAGVTYTAILYLGAGDLAPEDIIVLLNGVEADIYEEDGMTLIYVEVELVATESEFDGITVSLHTPEVGKALAKEAEVTNAVNYTAEYLQMCYDLATDPDSDFDISTEIEGLEAILGDTVLWMNSEGGEIFNGHVVTEEDTYFEAGVVLLVDEMEAEEVFDLKINFNEAEAEITSVLSREIAEQIGFEIPEGKMLVMAVYEYEAPFGEDEYFKPETDEEDPMDSRKTGWFVTSEETHAMIIGRAIITMKHVYNDNGVCTYCRHTEGSLIK